MKVLTGVLIAYLGLLSLPAVAAYGTPFEGWGFVSEDWQVVCDNTLTCRAAGYSEDGAKWRGSILMTVKAGEKVPSTEVLLNSWDWGTSEDMITQTGAPNSSVELWLDDKSYGEVEQSKLTKSQTMQLVNHATKNSKIVFKSGNYQWQISDKGMAAVLLKLDDVQGRVGSSFALISKNNSTRQKLKLAKAIPKIYAAAPYAISEYTDDASAHSELTDEQKIYEQIRTRYDQEWQDSMTTWAMTTLDTEAREDCNVLTSDQTWFNKDNKVWRFTPIDSDHTLASHPCWLGAYNFGSGYWLVDNANPSQPTLITISGSDYSKGEIFSAHKGRGLGDCWSMASWVWNGDVFAKAHEQTTGLCRLIQAGGAWDLPTYVSEVIYSDKAAPSKNEHLIVQ